jgi:hypothetical protein
VIEVNARIKMAGIEVAPAGNCPAKSHVENPEIRGALGSIERSAQAMNQEKDVLNKIIRLGCVPEDPQRNSADVTGVAAKQSRQRFPAPKANLGDQGLVRKTGFLELRLDCSRLLVGDPKFRQANCDRTVHDKEQWSEAAPLTTSVLMTSPLSPRPNLGIFSSALIRIKQIWPFAHR